MHFRRMNIIRFGIPESGEIRKQFYVVGPVTPHPAGYRPGMEKSNRREFRDAASLTQIKVSPG